MSHPPRETLYRYAGGSLSPPEVAELQQHLPDCALCKRELESAVAEWAGDTLSPQWKATSRTAETIPDPLEAPAPIKEVTVGTLIGRYVVVGHLGEGAMGQVLAAFDPRLERKVALKLLRSNVAILGNAALRGRLIREAKVLAQLTHPNVVHVHDVGDYGDSIFIAMDFVEGTTLTRWLSGSPHTWREVVRIFVMAGRGLSAAHAANLVHRDFKPDNVLVGRDAVVRVTDFGVARRVKETSTGGEGDDESLSGRSSLIGTPAYMSPEQLDGTPADPRSDQFSFCVALFEGLYGKRPFAGDTLAELKEAVRARRLAAIDKRRAPAWLNAIVMRGLSTRPEDRFASIDALLAKLEHGVQRRPVRLVTAAALGLCAIAAAVLGAREVDRRRNDPCETAEARALASWGPAQRARLSTAFRATALPFADDALASVGKRLDAWTHEWPASYARACAEGRSGNQQATAGALGRQACLENQRLQVAAMVDTLASATNVAVERAPLLVEHQLEAGCSAQNAMPSEPEDPKAREAVRKVRADLALARSLRETAKDVATPDAILELAARAKALGLAAEQTQALRLRAHYLRSIGTFSEAAEVEEEAVRVAEAGRADDEAVLARVELAWVVGVELGDLPRSRGLFKDSQAALERAGRPEFLVQRVLSVEAALASREGRLADALEVQKKVVEMRSRIAGPDSLLVAEALGALCDIERKKHLYDDALAHNQRSLEIYRAVLGNHHPEVALELTGRASIYAEQRDHAKALPFAEEAVKIMEDNPANGPTLQIAIYNLGLLYRRLERYPEAVQRIQHSLELIEKAGSPSYQQPDFLGGLAETYQEMSKYDLALDAATRAIELREKASGPEVPSLSPLLSIRGGVYVDLKRPADAAKDLERALQLMSGPDAKEELREVTRYDLARSLWFAPATRARAVQIAQEVRKYFAGKGPNYADYVAEADEWLKAHPK